MKSDIDKITLHGNQVPVSVCDLYLDIYFYI